MYGPARRSPQPRPANTEAKEQRSMRCFLHPGSRMQDLPTTRLLFLQRQKGYNLRQLAQSADWSGRTSSYRRQQLCKIVLRAWQTLLEQSLCDRRKSVSLRVKWELGPRCILQKDGRAKDKFFSGLEQFYLQSEMTPQGTLNFCRNGSNLPNKCFYFSCWGELVTFVKDNKPRGLHNQSGLDRGWFTHWASRDAEFYGVCQKSKVKCTIRLNALWCKNMFYPRAGPWEVCRFLKAL